MTAAADLGFTPGFLNQLRSLVMQNKRMLPGPGAGRRRSPRSGASAELMDYRPYAPGDDLRKLDWNVYARLDTLFTRVYRAEENLLVRIFLDVSRSMAFGEPAKFELARRVAGALAFVGLAGYDRVEASACGAAALQAIPTAQGEKGTPRVWSFLAGLSATGRGDFARQALEAASRVREPGLTIILSDGLYEGGLVPLLKRLRAAGHELAVVQVLDPRELDPALEGDWRLTDAEAPAKAVEVTLTPITARDYRDRIAAYTGELREFCRKQGAGYYLVSSDSSLEETVFGMMRGSLID